MCRCALAWLAFLSAAATSQPLPAEVIGSAAHGFRVAIKTEIQGSTQDIYRAIVDKVDRWWHPDHTYSGDANNLYIEPKKQGWFGETLPEGGCVCHLAVVYVKPGQALRFKGGLGPLQEMGIDGALTIQLTAVSDKTTELRLLYSVSGYDPQGLQVFAKPVDQVLQQQVDRLKEFVEAGRAVP